MTETTENLQPTPTNAPAPEATPRRGRTLLIAGGAALAGALLVGGGVAVGAALADDDRDDRDLVAQSDTRAQGSGAGNDAGANRADGGGVMDVAGATSAAELLEIIEAASTEAEGAPVDVELIRGGGWDVQFETAAGDETEVRVEADGTARVVSTDVADVDDSAPAGQLDAATVEALVAAAFDTAEGTITDLSVDDDTVSPYDVSVITGDGRTVEIDLGPDFAPLSTDVDTDD